MATKTYREKEFIFEEIKDLLLCSVPLYLQDLNGGKHDLNLY